MKPTDINFENVFAPYKARKLTAADIPDILDLYLENTEYFKHCPPSPTLETAKEDNGLKQYVNETNSSISKYKTYINERKGFIETTNKQLEELQKKLDKQLSVINRINNAKPNFVKYFFSLGIYAYLISQKRKNKISAKIKFLSDKINEQKLYISEMEKDIDKFTSKINICTQNIADKRKSIEKAKNAFELETLKEIDSIEPLKNTVSIDPKFMPLKHISGLQYEKITGCYHT